MSERTAEVHAVSGLAEVAVELVTSQVNVETNILGAKAGVAA